MNLPRSLGNKGGKLSPNQERQQITGFLDRAVDTLKQESSDGFEKSFDRHRTSRSHSFFQEFYMEDEGKRS